MFWLSTQEVKITSSSCWVKNLNKEVLISGLGGGEKKRDTRTDPMEAIPSSAVSWPVFLFPSLPCCHLLKVITFKRASFPTLLKLSPTSFSGLDGRECCLVKGSNSKAAFEERHSISETLANPGTVLEGPWLFPEVAAVLEGVASHWLKLCSHRQNFWSYNGALSVLSMGSRQQIPCECNSMGWKFWAPPTQGSTF